MSKTNRITYSEWIVEVKEIMAALGSDIAPSKDWEALYELMFSPFKAVSESEFNGQLNWRKFRDLMKRPYKHLQPIFAEQSPSVEAEPVEGCDCSICKKLRADQAEPKKVVSEEERIREIQNIIVAKSRINQPIGAYGIAKAIKEYYDSEIIEPLKKERDHFKESRNGYIEGFNQAHNKIAELEAELQKVTKERDELLNSKNNP